MLVKSFEKYLEQHAVRKGIITSSIPDNDLELIIVIPACNEKENLQQCLASLEKAVAIPASIEVLIILNDGMKPTEKITNNNQESYRLIKDYPIPNNPKLKILPVYVDISNDKKPGVGLARKIGMDEAVRRFLFLSKDGIIVCFDADCTVDRNYFVCIRNGFKRHPNYLAASIYFEHTYNYNKASIIQYESHLRYFIEMQRKINLPFAIQTIGSSMAVTAKGYCKYGGMNTKQAGEDFYFLQKFISNNTCFEINDTTVYPSDRGSQRVPFGTGRAVNKLEESQLELKTYHPDNFYLIYDFIQLVFKHHGSDNFTPEQFQSLNRGLIDFLEKNDFLKALNQTKRNTSSIESFQKRFFQWFNAFKLMKCLHSLRDSAYPDIEISKALELYFGPSLEAETKDSEEMLEVLRENAKNSPQFIK